MKMTRIIAPAVRIEQDGRPVFLTRFTVADFMSPGFYRVEKLDAQTTDGYQRVMDERRARRFAKVVEELGQQSAFLPTSVFLATERELDYDPEKCELSIETDKDPPLFLMVDGQHRAAGLKMAAMRLDNKWVRNFPVAAVIATELGKAEQMVQFLIVNSTQKKVAPDIGQQILARFTSKKGVENMPNLPSSIQTEIEIGADLRALELVRYLNESPDSPWRGKIQMVNQSKAPGMTAKQSMFVDSLKKHVLVHKHPLALQLNDAKRGRMLENYWRAVVHRFLGTLDDTASQDNPLFKSYGVDLFHQTSKSAFGHLARQGTFTETAFFACFTAAAESDELDENARKMFHPDWWKKGGPASGLNIGAVRSLADSLSNAIDQIDEGDGESSIQL